MDISSTIVGVALILVAIAHSWLGEIVILKPLLADDRWSVASGPRWPFERIIRGAWHLTSVAWIAMSAMSFGLDPLVAIAIMGGVCGTIVVVRLRGHVSWPLFLTIGFFAADAASPLPRNVLLGVLGIAAIIATAAGILHVIWAAGGAQASMQKAGPQPRDGATAFQPGPLLTLAVALALFVFAGLLVITATTTSTQASWLTAAGLAVLTVRVIGDGKQVGLSKTDRSTAFARADDALYTPIVVTLAFGAIAALMA